MVCWCVMRPLLLISFVLFLGACQEPSPYPDQRPDEGQVECDMWAGPCRLCCDPGYRCQRGRCIDGSLDLDFDGYAGHWDCDDYSNDTFPGAPEQCDDRDNDCDGQIDEGVRNDAGECAPPCRDDDDDGFTTCEGDCDDDNEAVNPTAEEVCDGVDNNCDGASDEGFDEDGDGRGACGLDGDCDDTDPLRAPGFNEVCDGIDNDCNDLVDDGTLCGRLGRCEDGSCRWAFDVTTDDVEHETGAADGAQWCAGPGDLTDVALIRGPARGMRDIPFGVYEAHVRAKVDQNTTSWRDCGVVLRLRANDRDGDGSGTCDDCYFGGDMALVARHFESEGVYESFTIPFSIGPEREDHLVEVVILRGRCDEVTVCVDSLTISERL